jgi:hypothetical protein
MMDAGSAGIVNVFSAASAIAQYNP